MSKSPKEYLQHILDEMEFLEKQRTSLTEEVFMRDEVRQRAFARSLEIIGEAAKQIPKEIIQSNSDIDWKGLIGLRDKLIHHYFGVDYAIVWDVITNELPDAQKHIGKIIETI